MRVIGSNLDTLNSATKKCHRAGGLPSVRTRYMLSFKEKVIFTCYGEDTAQEIPGGTIEDLPPRVVSKLRHADDKTDALLELADIETEKKETEKEREEKGVRYKEWGEWEQ